MTIADRINQAVRRVPAWSVYAVGLMLPVWLFWLGLSGGLGVEPVKEIEHRLGLWGLQAVIAALCVTPLRRFAGINLQRYRRAIGLLAFYYIVLHFLAWIVLDMGLRWQQALGDIVKRPYITIGMLALLLLAPLAATSNNWSVGRLGAARWQKLQRLVYVAALAGAVHFLWLVKAWPVEPFLYLGAILVLLAVRAIPKKRRVAP